MGTTTSVEFDVTETLDVTGLNCPMPVVKTKQAIDGVELLDQRETEDGSETVYKHYVRRTE